MIRSTTLIVISILVFFAVKAQEIKTLLSYQAQVVDTLTNKPLPYTICIINDKETGSIKRVAADSVGRLNIGQLRYKEYELTVTYIGYKDKMLIIHPIKEGMKRQVIALSPSTKQLDAVQITEEPKLLEISPEKLTVNVAQSVLAKGGTAFEVLTRTPGVIEQGNTIQFRGRSVNVHIDGRPSNFRSNELKQLLETMPSSSISKIEVITNPSAKHDAQGGTVINIVTVKSNNLGFSGAVTTGYSRGDYNNINGSFQLNYRREKIAAFARYDHLNTKQYYRFHSMRKTGEGFTQNEQEYKTIKNSNNVILLGLDYAINKSHSFNISFRGSHNRTSYNSKNDMEDLTDSPVDSSSKVSSKGKSVLKNPSVNLFYKWQIDTSGREVSLNLDYFRYKRDRSDFFDTNVPGIQHEDFKPERLRNISPGKNEVKSAAIDYVHPLKFGRIEAGLKSVSTTTDNNMRWEYFEYPLWKNDSQRSNHFIYTEKIQAAYVNGIARLGKTSVQLGLRMENTQTEGELITDGSVNKSNYFNLFPSISFNYTSDNQTQWGVVYRKKIDRYGFSVVNPFIYYRNPYSYTQGNPYIKPTYYDNFELSYFSGRVFGAISYSMYNGVLADVFRKDPASNVVITTYDNLAKAYQLDANISWSEAFFKRTLSTTTTLGALHAQYDSDDSQFNNAGYTFYLSSTNSVRITEGLSGEVYITYFSPFSYGVYEMANRFKTDVGLSQSLFKDQAQLAFSVTDIFNSTRNQYQVNSFGVYLDSTVKPESRFFKVSFTYQFGNKRVENMKAKKTGIESEQKRMF